MSKKSYFLKKKYGKDKPEISNINYLQMVDWNRIKGIEEESALLCIAFLYSFDLKTLLVCYTLKNEIKSTTMRKEN